jgi:hypothetical protein
MKEIARREVLEYNYVSRMVNMTTLAPDIVAAILDETLPSEITLFELTAGTPVLWEQQWGRRGRWRRGAAMSWCLVSFIGIYFAPVGYSLCTRL